MLLRWTAAHDPLRDFRAFQRHVDNVFAGLFDGSGRARIREYGPGRVGMVDKGEAFEVEADLPGLTHDDLEIEATAEGLRISGARNVDPPEGFEAESALRRERSALKFSRSVSFPVAVDVDGVTATLSGGILKISVPKRADVKPRQIAVKAA